MPSIAPPLRVCLRLLLVLLPLLLPTIAQRCTPNYQGITNLYPLPDPRAPDKFTVQWYTSVSSVIPVVLLVSREWSPYGADRFYQLVLDQFYDCAGFFRIVPDFVVQFGIAAGPQETTKWNTTIPDDQVTQSNTFGMVSYATAGPDTRTTQIFINTINNSRLDALGFSPFAVVISGMDVVLQLENPTPDSSDGVDQDEYTMYGNMWLLSNYPNISLIFSQGRKGSVTVSSADDGDDDDIWNPTHLILGCTIGSALALLTAAVTYMHYSKGTECDTASAYDTLPFMEEITSYDTLPFMEETTSPSSA